MDTSLVCGRTYKGAPLLWYLARRGRPTGLQGSSAARQQSCSARMRRGGSRPRSRSCRTYYADR